MDPEAGETTWSRIFDHSLDEPDPFAIEDDIAAEAAAVLCEHGAVGSLAGAAALPATADIAVTRRRSSPAR